MWARWALAALIVALAAMPVVLRYLVFWPLDQWQVDVEVYRQAGESILTGRPIYLAMTEAPQLLPFTYPPLLSRPPSAPSTSGRSTTSSTAPVAGDIHCHRL